MDNDTAPLIISSTAGALLSVSAVLNFMDGAAVIVPSGRMD